MIGTIVNTIAILAGGSLGTLLGEKLKEGIKKTVMQALSLGVLLIGFQMALATENLSIIIFSLLIGAIIGEIIKIEERLERLGLLLEARFRGREGISRGFVQCSLIYCVGAMAIMGALQEGLQQDPSILYAKALLDGFSAIAFASTLGIGVIFSAISVFVYQGSITLMAGWLQVLLTEEIIVEMTATGGLLIAAIGFNLLELPRIKVGNLLPAIIVVVFLVSFI